MTERLKMLDDHGQSQSQQVLLDKHTIWRQ
jgi:hypothetical protein